mmetsp:Transcript_31739/g.79719  ORF Transcript_31739/g.79719 Transcript_31739/m.79719 type:complete len:416 (-) Transcript_31739:3711-4958(-)
MSARAGTKEPRWGATASGCSLVRRLSAPAAASRTSLPLSLSSRDSTGSSLGRYGHAGPDCAAEATARRARPRAAAHRQGTRSSLAALARPLRAGAACAASRSSGDVRAIALSTAARPSRSSPSTPALSALSSSMSTPRSSSVSHVAMCASASDAAPRVPSSPAAATRAPTSSRARATLANPTPFPACANTPDTARSIASFTPRSAAPLSPVSRSPTRGSTRGCRVMSRPSAAAARCRTARAGSLRHFTNVVCSWGTKGFSASPPLSIITASAPRIADLTAPGYLSPKMRMSGPVIGITWGLIAAVVVDSTASRRPSAADSRSSACFPDNTPWRYTCTMGARPLGRHSAGMRISRADLSCRRTFSRAVSTALRTSGRNLAWSSLATHPITSPSAVHAAVMAASSGSMKSSKRTSMI